jgi:hypothetical protein
MNKKIAIIIGILVLLGAAAFFAYPVIKNRYFSQEVEKSDGALEDGKGTTKENGATTDETGWEKPTESEIENREEPAGNAEEGIGTESIDTNVRNGGGDVFAGITNSHCNSDCKAFANNFEYLEYCEQVCGISPIKDVSESDCKKKEDLQRDYCYKDLAINKKDASFCNNIKDSNVQKTCKTRITEDVIENL